MIMQRRLTETATRLDATADELSAVLAKAQTAEFWRDVGNAIAHPVRERHRRHP